LYGNELGIRIARKHIGWYAQHLPNGETLRKTFNRLQTVKQQTDLIEDFFLNLK